LELKELRNSDTFCVLPWMHLYKNMDNSIKLCCVDKGGPIGSLENNTIEEIRNSKEFVDLRESFLKGEKLDRCKECWQWEKNGYRSYRQSNNQDYIEQFPEEVKADEPIQITYLDYRPSNLCNLACKICSPRFSSKLIDPWAQLGRISDEEKSHLTKLNTNRIDVNTVKKYFSDIKYIYFAGGEPLIADDHWDLLKFFHSKNPGDIRVKYNTNLTKLEFKGMHVKDYWKDFKKIQIGASLDGYGVEFEHLRTGAKWDQVVFNLEQLKTMAAQVKDSLLQKGMFEGNNRGIELYCDSTVGWLNLKSVFKLHKFLVENEYVILDDNNYNKLLAKPLNFPYGASLLCTPPELKEELLESIEEYRVWAKSVYPFDPTSWMNDLDSLVNFINDSVYREKELTNWLEISAFLDDKYKLDTTDAFVFKSESWNKKFKELYFNKKLL